MNSLVLYYTHEGHTKFIADEIAKAIGGKTDEIRPTTDISKTGNLRYFIGGLQAISGYCPSLHDITSDIGDYDTIFICTPVWAGRPAPAIRSFLKSNPVAGKKIVFVCTYMGSPDKSPGILESLIPNSECIDIKGFSMPYSMDMMRESDKNTILAEISAWSKRFVSA